MLIKLKYCRRSWVSYKWLWWAQPWLIAIIRVRVIPVWFHSLVSMLQFDWLQLLHVWFHLYNSSRLNYRCSSINRYYQIVADKLAAPILVDILDIQEADCKVSCKFALVSFLVSCEEKIKRKWREIIENPWEKTSKNTPTNKLKETSDWDRKRMTHWINVVIIHFDWKQPRKDYFTFHTRSVPSSYSTKSIIYIFNINITIHSSEWICILLKI